MGAVEQSGNPIFDRWRALNGRGARSGGIEPLKRRSGSRADYQQLAAFHYLRAAPVTASRVLVIEDERRTIAGRYLQQGASRMVVGVLVESLPALSCRLRNIALGDRYSGWSDRSAAARLLNGEMRCISRVVVHPQWRGLGLAVELVRWALATMTTPYTEALAAMGRVHPFFRLAGMREYRRPTLARDQRLIDALRWAGLEPWDLARTGWLMQWLAGHKNGQEFVRRELLRWAGCGMDIDKALVKARDELGREPLYYLSQRATEAEGDADGDAGSGTGSAACSPDERECDERGSTGKTSRSRGAQREVPAADCQADAGRGGVLSTAGRPSPSTGTG